jgi:hypothetical protein
MATIMDYKSMMNIQSFGQCKSLANPIVAAATAANYGVLREMPCIPNTVFPWLKGKMDVTIMGQAALMNDCKLFCAYAGVIEVADDGQVAAIDSFDFIGEDEPLGVWNAETNDISRKYGSGYKIHNKLYNDWQKDYKTGGDFHLYSTLETYPVSKIYNNCPIFIKK